MNGTVVFLRGDYSIKARLSQRGGVVADSSGKHKVPFDRLPVKGLVRFWLFLFLESALGGLNEVRKSGMVGNGQMTKRLAVKCDPSLFQPVHELAVG